MTNDATILRKARAADAPAIADVWLRSFAAALPGVRRAHSDDAVHAWFRDVVVATQETWETWAAVHDDRVVGVMVLDGGWIEQLYLDPVWRGRGVGDRFVQLAKNLSPGGLELRTFQVNHPARRFYERHGFTAAEHTDGGANEEGEPDVRYVWRPVG
ncbi:GNAT family N-acetyltransferase [Nocardiopsis sp. NPDC058631]|uniref:GNAT family N-acetyltransferase n=1 Tax=Nocardiopsis sp. NPDC058631 TaxID=3346566 RepID=UPI003653905A